MSDADVEKTELLEEIEEEKVREAVKPLTLEELKEILGSTVKHDDANKLITFLAMLTAYTEDSQFNVSFRAPSSTGKSYIPIELSQYFPKEDVMMIAYSSPTAFYHDTGKWDDQHQAIIIDLERKILIFLDQPHDMLLQRLRPLLSHDQKELLYKITDKREKKGLRTKNVIIRGFPSVIFCTGNLRIDEQEATRNFILSPETSVEKIREGIYLKALRKGNPKLFEEYLREYPERQLLRIRIMKIKEENIKHVIIEDIDKVIDEFLKRYPKAKPRHQRDIERIISLIQGLALLNLWHRKRDDDNNLYADNEDIENAFKLFEAIGKSQELGIPPYVYNFFKEVIEPLWDEINKDIDPSNPIGLSRKQILMKHYEVYGRVISEKYLKNEILAVLENSGQIYQEKDPMDKRRSLVYVVRGDPPPPKYIESNQNESKNIIDKIIEMYRKGLSLRRISRELNLSYSKVWRTVQEYRKKGDSSDPILYTQRVGVGEEDRKIEKYPPLTNIESNQIPEDLKEYFDPGFDEYTVKCKLCGSFFSRNRAVLEAHLRYHERRGDLNV